MTVRKAWKCPVGTGSSKGSPLLAIFLSYFIAVRSYLQIIDTARESGNLPARIFMGCNKMLRNRFRLMMGEKTAALCIGLFDPSTFLEMTLLIISR